MRTIFPLVDVMISGYISISRFAGGFANSVRTARHIIKKKYAINI
jgi:hypothetical protein